MADNSTDERVNMTSENKPSYKTRKMTLTRAKCIESVHTVTIDCFTRRSNELTIDSVHRVIKQLGYLPYNLVEVAAFSQIDANHPLILKLYPLNTNDLKGRYAKSFGKQLPFPTMFWMSCPALHTRISELEDAGWIQVFQDRLESSEVYLEMMENAHKQYAAERWGLLSEEDLEYVQTNGWVGPVKQKGIAGMQEFRAVKCLHCHYAHFLARPDHRNVIGEWVHEQLLLGTPARQQKANNDSTIDELSGAAEGLST